MTSTWYVLSYKGTDRGTSLINQYPLSPLTIPQFGIENYVAMVTASIQTIIALRPQGHALYVVVHFNIRFGCEMLF